MIATYPRYQYSKRNSWIVVLLISLMLLLRILASCEADYDPSSNQCPNMGDCEGEVYGGGACNVCDP